MDKAPFASPSTKPHTILAVAQWVVAAFLAYMVVGSVLDIQALPQGAGVTNLTLFALAFVGVTALAQIPPVFFKASLNARYAIYGVTVVALLFLGTQESQFRSTSPITNPSWPGGISGASEPLVTCSGIIPSIIDLSKKDGPEVFEINDVTTEWAGSNLRCSGMAETSRGRRRIEYGSETTPQGKVILNLKL